MKQLDHRSWPQSGFRILIGGVVLWGFVVGIVPRSQADDKTDRRSSRQNQPKTATSAPSKSKVAEGFRPDFSRKGTGESTNLPSNPSAKATQSAGATPAASGAFKSSQGGSERQLVVLLDDKSKKEKEKPPKVERVKPEPKPKTEKPKTDGAKGNPPPAGNPNSGQHPAVKPQEPKIKVEKPKTGNGDNVPRVKKSDAPPPMNKPPEPKVKIEKPIQPKSPKTPDLKGNPNLEIKTGDKNRSDPGRGKIEIRKPGDKEKPTGDKLNLGTEKIKIRKPDDKPDVSKPNLNLDKGDAASKEKPPRLKDGQTLSRDHLRKVKQDLALEQTKLKDGKPVERIKVAVTPELKKLNAERLERLPREQLKIPVAKNGTLDKVQIDRLKIRPANETFNDRLKSGDFNRFAKLKSGNAFQVQRQFTLHRTGDISRRMNLLPALQARGGWRHRHFGVISPLYSRHVLPMWYSGPSFCSPYLWYPRWSPWVDWCWWDTCSPIYDPRPIFCRPIHYHPCGPWVAWRHPVWQPLPFVTCGTWVDVDPVIINNGMDLQLLATRFVDPGHPTQELGPRFRVWFRNNSPFAINQPFNVLLLASTDANAFAGLPEAGVRIPSIGPGEVQSVDIRLPFAANFLGRDSQGRSIPFSYLNVFIDSHNELPEANEANNGSAIVRGDILPVDPVIFAADPAHVEPNGVIHLAGEGFGPEPGKAVVVIGDQEFDAEILGWFDLGVQIRIPDFALTDATAADLLIVRGDGAASPPLTIEIDPSKTDAAYAEPVPGLGLSVGPELPAPPPLPE